jgi:hypothetical protein
MDVLFDPTRAARMQRSATPGFDTVIDGLLAATWYADNLSGEAAAIQRQTSMIVLQRMLQLAVNGGADAAVRATTLDAVNQLDDWLAGQSIDDRTLRGHYSLARYQIDRMRSDPSSVDALISVSPPPGGPIG